MAVNVKSEAGSASGVVTADLKAPDLGVRGDLNLKNLDLAPILKNPAQKSDITGLAKVDLKVPSTPAGAPIAGPAARPCRVQRPERDGRRLPRERRARDRRHHRTPDRARRPGQRLRRQRHRERLHRDGEGGGRSDRVRSRRQRLAHQHGDAARQPQCAARDDRPEPDRIPRQRVRRRHDRGRRQRHARGVHDRRRHDSERHDRRVRADLGGRQSRPAIA